MKKFFTLLGFLMMGATTFAQNIYVFCDKDGNIYENNATITCTDVKDDGFGSYMVPSGLFVKNSDAPNGYSASAIADITKMDNGVVQLCFPINCISYNTTGKQAETGKVTLANGELKDLMTEWMPTAYGECTVTYTLKTYNSLFNKGSRTITVNYRWDDPASINQIKSNKTTSGTYYNLKGQRVEKPTKGLYIRNNKKVVMK